MGTRTTKPTLTDVAALAGVSKQTISNVLNSPERVKPDTRDRVHAAIEELGYRQNAAARRLRLQRTHTIGMRLPGLSGEVNSTVHDRFLHALVHEAQSHGYGVRMFVARDDHDEIRSFEQMWEASDVDAFVLTDTHPGDPRPNWLRSAGVPFSAFGRPWDGATEPTHSWVGVDGAGGTELATQHLIERGHTRIAFMGWGDDHASGSDRMLGWQRALGANGITADDTWISVVTDPSRSEHAAGELIGRAHPTAIVCATDALALGARQTTAGRIAVTGFDDTAVAHAMGITSVVQPLAAVAKECIDQVFAQLDGDLTPRTAILPTTLSVRASSTL